MTAHVRQSGQGMVEYIVMVALIAVAAIAVFQLLGQVIRAQTAAIAHELAGEDASALGQAASNAAQSTVKHVGAKNLKSFSVEAEVTP